MFFFSSSLYPDVSPNVFILDEIDLAFYPFWYSVNFFYWSQGWLHISLFAFYVTHRCQDVGSGERQRERKEEKCPFRENSGSEEDVLQILQYMATILGRHVTWPNNTILCLTFRNKGYEMVGPI